MKACSPNSIALSVFGASLMAQMVKHLSTMRETRVRSLGQEDPLEKGMATHSSTLAWKIPWMEEPGGLQSMGRKELDVTERLHFHFVHLHSALTSPRIPTRHAVCLLQNL